MYIECERAVRIHNLPELRSIRLHSIQPRPKHNPTTPTRSSALSYPVSPNPCLPTPSHPRHILLQVDWLVQLRASERGSVEQQRAKEKRQALTKAHEAAREAAASAAHEREERDMADAARRTEMRGVILGGER